ncbi:response regulator transcription factor [Oceanispirochaeta sp.]|jgi:DNA-binding response OmpR family regulator|uniref:response regulator transcription factor n=1 Tax=Oceanispirochaeta sp. TaxID=2035350 RepID=UPI002623B842|nr:response regulator transcription factor [Oceanispirochaeta sp.]MDA3956279.1 response regulator transcription factor [Oceanispirochaeta sp.]
MTPETQTDTVLIIEDDSEIAAVVSMNLEDLGMKTEHVIDGKTGLRKALEGKYVLVILDIMPPQLDGISVCRAIREQDSVIPIMMLTAKADVIDRVLALELGADDYMTKPFSVRELTARVKALLRRSRASATAEPEDSSESKIVIGQLTIDKVLRKVLLHNEIVELTVKEFELLGIFARNPGRSFSRGELLKMIWGYQYEGYEHTVNTHIKRLRNKIEEDPTHPVYLKTVWGVGYRFAELSEFS